MPQSDFDFLNDPTLPNLFNSIATRFGFSTGPNASPSIDPHPAGSPTFLSFPGFSVESSTMNGLRLFRIYSNQPSQSNSFNIFVQPNTVSIRTNSVINHRTYSRLEAFFNRLINTRGLSAVTPFLSLDHIPRNALRAATISSSSYYAMVFSSQPNRAVGASRYSDGDFISFCPSLDSSPILSGTLPVLRDIRRGDLSPSVSTPIPVPPPPPEYPAGKALVICPDANTNPILVPLGHTSSLFLLESTRGAQPAPLLNTRVIHEWHAMPAPEFANTAPAFPTPNP